VRGSEYRCLKITQPLFKPIFINWPIDCLCLKSKYKSEIKRQIKTILIVMIELKSKNSFVFSGLLSFSVNSQKSSEDQTSNVMLIFQVDQLDNLVKRQNQIIGDLQSRVERLENVGIFC
jgi:hypothetical protein